MAFVVKNDLQSFADKLKNYKAQGDLADKVLDKVLQKGEEIARKQYDISDKGTVINKKGQEVQSSITITSSKSGNTGKITSTGSQVAYLEFGTGVNGEGTYDGKLPTEPITFNDNSGKTWTTQGWEYYYRYNQTHQGEPFEGQTAKMQMFKTAKELREYIQTDLAKDIRKGD